VFLPLKEQPLRAGLGSAAQRQLRRQTYVRHMGALKAAGLVVDRLDAQWARYRRNPNLSPAVVAIVEAVIGALPRTEQAAA
jgi:DNA-binding transcriptional ArsR family regulator